MSLEFLEAIREYELGVALHELRHLNLSTGRLLEVGAGSGWQARLLARSGYSVEAIDLEESTYLDTRIWNITNYDGEHIPFSDNEFDVVFSSNVLEHVRRLDRLQKEIWRVLKPTGVALHVVPSATWRLWTNLTYYPARIRGLSRRLMRRAGGASSGVQTEIAASPARSALMSALLPRRHGEAGNALTEMFHFSRFSWEKRLECDGWRKIRYVPNQLLYSGNNLLGQVVGLHCRRRLSRFLGSSCHVFALRKTE